MKTEKEKLIYLAGLIDGDGCFNSSRTRSSYTPRIFVTNTDEEIMKWLVANFGGSYARSVVRGRPLWKPRYSWRLANYQALELAYKLKPYLIIKFDAACVFEVWAGVMLTAPRWERKYFYEILTDHLRRLNLRGLSKAGASK